MNSVIRDHIESSELPSTHQWGFTPGKTTVTALVSTFHTLLVSMESGMDVAMVFFDLRKAFDSHSSTSHLRHLPTRQRGCPQMRMWHMAVCQQ